MNDYTSLSATRKSSNRRDLLGLWAMILVPSLGWIGLLALLG